MADKSPKVVKAVDVTARTGTAYLSEYAVQLKGREKRFLGDLFGLTQFGVNLLTLAPGSWASHRHWHEAEDELIYVLEGEVTLIDDQSGKPVVCLEVGTRARDEVIHYAEADMRATKSNGGPIKFTRRDGSPG
jgi:uncharacterized cupin superfamily protein